MSEPLTVREDCMGCGACVHMCEAGALLEAQGQVVVRRSRCNGCGRCVPFCPIGAITPRPRVRRGSSVSGAPRE